MTGLINFFDSIYFIYQIFNPISFSLSFITEKNFNLISYEEYIERIEKDNYLIDANLTTLLEVVVKFDNTTGKNKEEKEKIIKNLQWNNSEIKRMKYNILCDISNYSILSIFLIIASMLTFSMRHYNDDWNSDMKNYFWVFIYLFYIF